MESLGNPAESLLGMKLDDGWEVIEIVKRKPEDTGGHFSVCYIVKKNNTKAFLKAIDLSDALSQTDFMDALNQITTAFIFERDLLYKCKDNHLSKIVTPLAHGKVSFPGQPSYFNVSYIIFEMADSNLRNHLVKMRVFDLAWILRSLHNTAVALEQLHKSEIAHQDLKPSNVLVFNKESKVGDLGRSSDKHTPSANDKRKIPGDRTYAPFDLFYDINVSGNFQLRYASDLFHLGSLVFFYFLNVNLQEVIWTYIINHDLKKNIGGKDFSSDLPIFQEGFTYALDILNKEIQLYSNELNKEIIPLVKMLCEIDPQHRGHSENLRMNINQYSLERFISSFDILAKKAEYRLYEHN